jgi:lon-related putative ATP-dependent protease
MKKFKIYHSELIDINTKHIKLMLELKKALEKNDSDSIGAVVETVLGMVADNFEYPSIKVFVNEMKQFIVANIGLFVQFMNTMEPMQTTEQPIAGEERFDVFKVNVIVDNSNTVKPPIIIETTPSFTNLFGAIERTIDKNGFWRTDFTKIRAGAILRADGGFLVVNANDLFEEQGVWQALKRVLLYNKLEIQTFESLIQFSQVYIKPEPINVNLKVIIIGGLTLYKMLYEYEKGFKKIFKINAQFDYESNLNDSIIKNYARFAAKISNEENLAHCTPSGVAAVIEWAVEQAGSKDKITLKFSDVADVIREAAFYDRYSVKKHIDRNDVEKAIEMHRFRNDLFDQKMKDVILDGIVLIDVKGQRVGQVNGLTVIDDGLISFGKPARITATASVGRAGIINIEREADLSGSIHNKGMLIITSFLRERFADKYPLTLTASIAFEQNYGGIDGDSASAAEIYVLISAITGLPLNQNMALTGSMNQKGDIQPIGGVNQKVTGFFEICKAGGFTGNQGVLVPEQNVKDLMLRKEITDDVRNGNFHVYSYSSIDDGFELMFGIPCGRKDKNGNYPEGTVYQILTEKLKLLWEASKSEKQDK